MDVLWACKRGGLLAAALAIVVATAGAADRAPAFELPRLDSSATFSSETLRGHVAVVTFWASWCTPRALADLAKLERELGPRGFTAIAINLDEDESAARLVVGAHPLNVAHLRDATGATPLAFGVQAMPTTYLVGCDGTIHSRHVGKRQPEIHALRAAIEALLDEGCKESP